MKTVALLSTMSILLVTCVILQCSKSKRATRVASELGALRINIVNLNGPAASYDVSCALYRYESGSHPGGWPNDSVVGFYAFTEHTFLWDSLEPNLYDLWVRFGADVDGDGIGEPVWAPTLVVGIRIGRDSISFTDVSPSGIAWVESGENEYGEPVGLEWTEHIEPR